jgi:hypothetical protein
MVEVVAETAVKTLLTGWADLTTLTTADRIWAGTLPVGFSVPAVTFNEVGDSPVVAHDGPAGTTVSRVQVDCWASSRASAWQVYLAVNARLDGFSGAAGSVNVMAINRAFRIARRELDPQIHRVIADYRVGYHTAALV